MGISSDNINKVIPLPPPPDPIEVAVGQLIAYYQSNGIAVSPAQQQDGSIHLIDSQGQVVAIVYSDGAVEERFSEEEVASTDPSEQVCEEPNQSYAQADSCDPQTQSCPLYHDDGTQLQNVSTAFADASPRSNPTPPPVAAASPKMTEIAVDEPSAPDIAEEQAAEEIDPPAVVATETSDATAAPTEVTVAAGTMEVATTSPSVPAVAQETDLGLPAAGSAVTSAQLLVGADVDTMPSPDAPLNHHAAAVAELTSGTALSSGETDAVGWSVASAAQVALDRLMQQIQQALTVEGSAVAAHATTIHVDGSNFASGTAAVDERFSARDLSQGGAVPGRNISADVFSAAAPACDGGRIPLHAVSLGGTTFCIEMDPARIAEAQKGQGGQPHIPTIGDWIRVSVERDPKLLERVAQADQRRNSGGHQGNGGDGRDGQDERRESWEEVAFVMDNDIPEFVS